jgi:hypothetical protein
MFINKADKLPQTTANPTNVFSERLPRFPKIFDLQNIHQQ